MVCLPLGWVIQAVLSFMMLLGANMSGESIDSDIDIEYSCTTPDCVSLTDGFHFGILAVVLLLMLLIQA